MCCKLPYAVSPWAGPIAYFINHVSFPSRTVFSYWELESARVIAVSGEHADFTNASINTPVLPIIPITMLSIRNNIISQISKPFPLTDTL